MGGIEGREDAQAGAAVAGFAEGWFLTRLLIAIAAVGGGNDRGGLLGHPKEGLSTRYDARFEVLMCPALPDSPEFWVLGLAE